MPGLLYKPTFEPQASQREAHAPATIHSVHRTVSQTSYTETAGDEFWNWLQVVPVSDEIDPGASGGGVAWGSNKNAYMRGIRD
jgi:hypothetical protein